MRNYSNLTFDLSEHNARKFRILSDFLDFLRRTNLSGGPDPDIQIIFRDERVAVIVTFSNEFYEEEEVEYFESKWNDRLDNFWGEVDFDKMHFIIKR